MEGVGERVSLAYCWESLHWEGWWPPSDLQHSSGLGDDPELPSSRIHVETQGSSDSVSEGNALCC